MGIGCTLGGYDAPFTIGWSPVWGRPFQGRIDQVRLFDRVLSDKEIQTVYRSESGMLGTPPLRIRVSQVELCWDTEPGVLYQLQYTSALLPGWLPVSTNAIRGTGGMFCTNDTVMASEQAKFYRLTLTNGPSGF